MVPGADDVVWAAYRATRYVAFVGGDALVLRVGEGSPDLDALLDAHRARTWCFITAWNPMSERLDEATNRARNRALLAEIEARSLPWYDAEGRGDDGRWPAEASFLVLGISHADAVTLARRFEQRAIVCGERGGVARLIDCTARTRDTHLAEGAEDDPVSR